MLSFQEFQKQVLTVFGITEKQCKFANNCTYLGAIISYDNYRIVFDVKYIKSNGQWHIQKTYTQRCETFSDSLTQGIKTIDKQITDSIRRNAVFLEYLESLDELPQTKNK